MIHAPVDRGAFEATLGKRMEGVMPLSPPSHQVATGGTFRWTPPIVTAARAFRLKMVCPPLHVFRCWRV